MFATPTHVDSCTSEWSMLPRHGVSPAPSPDHCRARWVIIQGQQAAPGDRASNEYDMHNQYHPAPGNETLPRNLPAVHTIFGDRGRKKVERDDHHTVKIPNCPKR